MNDIFENVPANRLHVDEIIMKSHARCGGVRVRVVVMLLCYRGSMVDLNWECVLSWLYPGPFHYENGWIHTTLDQLGHRMQRTST